MEHCKYSCTMIILRFQGGQDKSSNVLLPNMISLVHYLSILKPGFMATSPWKTLTVKHYHVMNTYHFYMSNF